MINLESFGLGKVQDFISLLEEFANNGITDNDMIRKELVGYVSSNKENMLNTVSPVNSRSKTCKYCKTTMVPAKESCGGSAITIDGKSVIVCKKCSYSEVIG